MINNAIKYIWSLSYQQRRAILKYFNPVRYYRLQRMRAIERDGYSFKPFIEKKCIFIHIPKCAGVSLCKSLFGNLAGGHTKIEDYMIAFDKEEFESFFKFTFVRNPWDRLVSAFHFLKGGGMEEEDRLWAEKNLSRYRDFDDFVSSWVNKQNIETKVHFVPQYRFVCKPGSSRPNVNFIGFYENLEEDFSYIKNRLGIETVLIDTNKTSGKKRDFREYYNDKTKAIIADVYRKDIEMFGYDFDNTSLIKQLSSKSQKERELSMSGSLS